MPVTLAPPQIERKPKSRGPSGGGFGQGGQGDDSHRWDSGDGDHQTSADSYRLAMWLGLASVVMLFAGLSSAYIIRMGSSPDWRAISIPGFLLPNTVILLASSMTLEMFRRKLTVALTPAARLWIGLTTLLGAAFLAGQIGIWRALVAQGIYLSSNSHSSFFYLMTGAHGVHLAGGVIALLVLTAKAWSLVYATRGLRILTDVTAIYWHFMDGLWIYLFVLLFFWR
ncbi:MAG: cytochrome c oxidase subunit 3 [Acidobacteria bacterium]|nr:cytochrome c oxidase subunit 3 [Acidobacteriota bacterium]MCI0625446.1 cytochrome c oxidase subunit 3 [Acidobacteriota bacterium]